MMFQGYPERGFVAEAGDIEVLTKLLGHPPRPYLGFARETAASWEAQKQPVAQSRAGSV
jgi:hypothetical protein